MINPYWYPDKYFKMTAHFLNSVVFSSAVQLKKMTVVQIITALLRRLLVENGSKRYTINQIKEHQWFKKNFNRPALGIESFILIIL